jgi:hypothetical protein
MQRYGCSHADLLRINGGKYSAWRGGALYYFLNQRNAALGVRGIEFHLSLTEWHEIWERSGHFHERGRGHGRYVMSRLGDKGAYEVGNVFIQLADENGREAIQRTHARFRSMGMRLGARSNVQQLAA